MTSLTHNKNGKNFDLPEGLKDRCMRIHGWDGSNAEKALKGYRQFIKLKLQQEDWDATILSPSPIVNLVWQQHILDVNHYNKACQDYCSGEVIGHNPDDYLDGAARAKRIKSTKLSLKALFGQDVDKTVWPFGDDENNAKKNKAKTIMNGGIRKKRRIANDNNALEEVPVAGGNNDKENKANTRGIGSSNKKIKISFLHISEKTEEYEETFFLINPTTKLGEVFKAFAKSKGQPVADFRFLLHGKHIVPSETPSLLELSDGVQIDVMMG